MFQCKSYLRLTAETSPLIAAWVGEASYESPRSRRYIPLAPLPFSSTTTYFSAPPPSYDQIMLRDRQRRELHHDQLTVCQLGLIDSPPSHNRLQARSHCHREREYSIRIKQYLMSLTQTGMPLLTHCHTLYSVSYHQEIVIIGIQRER